MFQLYCLIHVINILVMATGQCTCLGIRIDPIEQNIYKEA